MFKRCLALFLAFSLVVPFNKFHKCEAMDAMAMVQGIEIGAMLGGPPGMVIGGIAAVIVVYGAAAFVANSAASFSAEHTKGKRPSTKGKHERGQARKNRDAGKEKGDVRRNNPWGRW